MCLCSPRRLPKGLAYAVYGVWRAFVVLFGSVLSGFIVGNTDLKQGRRYGVALCVEVGLLIISLLLFYQHLFWGHFLRQWRAVYKILWLPFIKVQAYAPRI